MNQVPIHDIDAAHGLWHLRRVITPAAVRKLKTELEAEGQLTPLMVRAPKEPGGRLQLISGRLRLEAATALGWTHVQVRKYRVSIAEAASMALRAEYRTGQPQTYLERAWAAEHTRRLRAAGGEPAEIRPMAAACGLTRSTLWNAITIGRVVTPELVTDVAHKLDVPPEKFLSLPQAPLLAIAGEGVEGVAALLRTAAEAHIQGASATKAVRRALEPAQAVDNPSGKTQCVVTEDGQVSLTMGKEHPEFSPPEAVELARQLLIAARNVDGRRPIVGRIGQALDTFTRKLWHRLRQLGRMLSLRVRDCSPSALDHAQEQREPEEMMRNDLPQLGQPTPFDKNQERDYDEDPIASDSRHCEQ